MTTSQENPKRGPPFRKPKRKPTQEVLARQGCATVVDATLSCFALLADSSCKHSGGVGDASLRGICELQQNWDTRAGIERPGAVSYTHLTLPTIYSV